MGKFLKFAGIFFAGLVVLLALATTIFALSFNSEQLQPHIEKLAQNHLDRDVNIKGPIALSVFPWLGVTAENISVYNTPGFIDETLAHINRLHIRVKLLPLLSRTVEVDRITVEGLTLNLEKNTEGIGNWQRTGPDVKSGTSSPEPATTTPKDATTEDNMFAFGALAIAGLTIEHSQITWMDRTNNDHWTIDNFTLSTDALAVNEPVPIKLSLEFSHPEAQLTNSMNLAANLRVKPGFKVFFLDHTSLQTNIKSPSVPTGELSINTTTDAELDLNENRLKLTAVKLQWDELSLSSNLIISDLFDKPQTEGQIQLQPFNLAELLAHWGIVLPAMKDDKAMTQASAEFSLKTTATTVLLEPLTIQLDKSALQGRIQIDNTIVAPFTHFNIHIDQLNVDNYLPAQNPKKPSKTTLASPAAALAAGLSALPAETLRRINAEGILDIGLLTIQKLNLKGLSLTLSAKQGLVKTQQTVDSLYQGSYQGSLDFNGEPDSPKIAMQEKFVNLQLEPLLMALKGKAVISGKLNLATQLQSIGIKKSSLKSTLTGQFNFLLTDSAIKGFNLQKIIDKAKTASKDAPVKTDYPKEQTLFSQISGTGRIVKGVITNRDLIANATKLKAKGSGTIDLNTDQLDYKIKARLLESGSAMQDPEAHENMPIKLSVTGTLDQPHFSLDVTTFLLEQNKDKIERKKEKLLKKLDKKLGPGASDLLKRFF